MTKNTKKLAAISIAAAASLPLFGISGERAPISGSHVIDGDLSIRFRPSSMYADGWGIKADAGETVSSSGPWTVTIDFLEPDYAAGADAGWGIWVQNGGRVAIDGAVIINGAKDAMTGLLVYDALSEISVGDGSRIYAGRDGMAAAAYGGRITIGDNAVLWGNTWGGEGGTLYSRDGGSIVVGNNAVIVHDGADSGQNYYHRAAFAASGSSITIGDDAEIRQIGAGVEKSRAVVAGTAGSDAGGPCT